MILTCPACGTSYTVKDGAIPPHGRNVRCAACKHSWHQHGEAAAAGEPVAEVSVPEPIAENSAPFAPPEPTDHAGADGIGPGQAVLPDPPLATAQGDVGLPGDAVAAFEEVPPEVADAPAAENPIVETEAADEFPAWNEAGYGDEEPAPRRKGLMIVLLLILFIAALAAAAWFLAPREWMARAGLVGASSDSPLKLMVTSQDRQKLASGNDLVSLSGRVINPTDATQPVPALQADLRDGGGKLVYSWTIAPPTARLAPRASASFNAAELGVPANATSLTLRWAN